MKWFKPSYTVFSGENVWSEFFTALRCLFFGMPNQDTVKQFEIEYAKTSGCRFAIAFGAGRMALYAILRTVNIGKNDEVILQAFTCNVVPRAIRSVCAQPVYVDIEAKDFNIDISQIDKAITDKTRAIIVQHSFGIPPNLELIKKVIGDRNILIIEDCAHAFKPAKYYDINATSDFVFFSTDHTKPLNTQVGGVACTESEQDAEQLRLLAMRASRLSFLQRIRMIITFLMGFLCHRPYLFPFLRVILAAMNRLKISFVWPDEHQIASQGVDNGFYSMTPFQAFLGLSQLRRIDENIMHRRAMFDRLQSSIGWYKSHQSIPVLRYAFLVSSRPSFLKGLCYGLSKSVWFDSPISGGRSVYQDVRYEEGSCPVAEIVSQHIVNISITSKMPISLLKQFDQFDKKSLFSINEYNDE